MAITLKFYHGSTEKIDLQDTSSPYIHVGDGWMPLVTTPAGDDSVTEYVTERIPIWISAANENGLATELQKIHQLQRLAAQYHTGLVQARPIWLYRKLDSETGTTRTLVKSISITLDDSMLSPPGSFDELRGTLLVERHPAWEDADSANTNFTNSTPAAAASVEYDYYNDGTVAGDVPARVEGFMISSYNAAVDPLDRVWVGVRGEDKYGVDSDGFVRVWELEDGTNVTDASDAVDATASGGNCVNVVPGGGDYDGKWDQTLGINFDDVNGAATGANQYGTHLWLLRAKVDADTVFQVQLRWGYVQWPTAKYVRGEIMTVNSTSWNFYEGGSAQWPLYDAQGFDFASLDTPNLQYEIEIWALRISGSGDLDLDCLCPIPIDEGFLYIEGMDLDATTQEYCVVTTSPRDRTDAIVYDPQAGPVDVILTRPLISAPNWHIPPGKGRMIVVYARSASSVIGDRIEFNESTAETGFRERWLTLRGSE